MFGHFSISSGCSCFCGCCSSHNSCAAKINFTATLLYQKVVRNGPTCVHQAADPKVYYDQRLDGGKGAWAMFFFGTDKTINNGRAGINLAVSRDLRNWTK